MMLSPDQKRMLAVDIERKLLEMKLPDLPIEKPKFILWVIGETPFIYEYVLPVWEVNQGDPRIERKPWNYHPRYWLNNLAGQREARS